MITVYYDGICGLCSKEINYYRGIAPDSVFEWIDVASNPNAMNDYKITQSQALLYLHAIDAKEVIYIGSDAFALIWKNIPRWKILGLCKIIYTAFAKYRFKKNIHCQLASTELS
jgi:predicted DCC family thiol-disulfide oxidoreductase YuxK